LLFVAPLVLADHEERALQAVLDPEGGFKIIGLAPDKEAQARCTTPVDVGALLAELEGIEFGPSFRWIDALWSGKRETVARLCLPDAVGKTDGYWLHPGPLDACFQAAGATLAASAGLLRLIQELNHVGTPPLCGWSQRDARPFSAPTRFNWHRPRSGA
jgi:hypothetical protein